MNKVNLKSEAYLVFSLNDLFPWILLYAYSEVRWKKFVEAISYSKLLFQWTNLEF